MSVEVSALKRVEFGSRITNTFWLAPSKELLLSTYLGRKTIATFCEKQSPAVQRQLSHVFVIKACGGNFEPCRQWLRAQKATEKATTTLAAIEISFLWRISNFLTSVSWFANIKLFQCSRWVVDYSCHVKNWKIWETRRAILLMLQAYQSLRKRLRSRGIPAKSTAENILHF